VEAELRFGLMEPGEEVEVSALVWEVFGEFEAANYEPRGIEEFRSFITPEKLKARSQEEVFFVLCCKAGGKIVAVAAARENQHLCLLFVQRKFQRRGIARRLVELTMERCRQAIPDLASFTVNSGRYAVPVYERLGFRATGVEQEKNGIRFTPMVLDLTPDRTNRRLEMREIGFYPADAQAALKQLPASAAVFALYGAEAHAEPYIGRTPNLRARLARLLQPSDKHPRRLQLAGRVRQIRWRLTGSEFESLLVQFSLLEKIYGPKVLERMHLGAPAFIRFFGGNAYPRIAVTNHPSQREADWAYGPFPSRAAAERFADEALKLFLLRRCTEELEPDPSHPGCVYSEMKMCLAPCYKGCTDERYSEEAAAVEQFLATRGDSSLGPLRAQREKASANLEFEAAAALHVQVQRIESVRALASELVRPLSQLRAVVLQASANPSEVAIFLYENGRLSGPQGFSMQGMRIQNEQSGSTSLFAHPMAIEPIPEEPEIKDQSSEISKGEVAAAVVLSESTAPEVTNEARAALPTKLARGVLEARMEAALAELAAPSGTVSPTIRQGHLALLKRWYYRAEARRSGEIFFPDAEGRWPIKAMLRGAGRVAGRMLAAANHSE
jgi:GNAT superfamily N-acetyltransferase